MSEKKKIALSDISKKNPYAVPKDYFETFSERVMQRIEAEEQTSLVVIRNSVQRRKKLVVILSLAASLVLFFGLGRYLMLNRESSVDGQIAALSDSEIIAYLETEDINSENMSDIPEVIRSADELSSESLETKNTSSIEQYLDEEGF